MTKRIKHIGVGHHPFSKKYEFKGYFDEPVPCLIATDYKAPKTVLELHYEDGCDIYEEYSKGSDKLTKSLRFCDADEQADFTQTEAEEWATEFAIRAKEGNLDPIPKINVKQFEQYDFSYVSLFSGIGGFEQALNKLGGTCVLASEIDKFANQAYEVLYGHPTAGDITKIDAKDVPDHDLLVGGFPCQSFSVAGKRLGFEDTRGTLFFEVARIAREKQPKVILLENVKGLVGHDRGKTLDTIVKTLNDIGYTVDFEVLNSKYFGVPQNRERIFIIAVRDDLIEQEPWIIEGNTVVPKGKRRISAYEGVKTFNFDWPEQTEVTTRLRDILEKEVDEKYYLDEEKTAKLVAKLSEENQRKFDEVNTERIVQLNGDRDKPGLSTNESEAYTVPANPMSDRGQLLQEPQMLGHIDLKGHDAIKRVYSTESVSLTLTTMGGGHREPEIAEEQEVRPVLTPDRMEKRQNGRRFKEDGEPSFTLNTQDRHGVAIREATKQGYAIAEEGDAVNFQFPDSKTRRGRVGKQIANTLEASSINQGVVESPPKYRIRKLTPRECFRLQNFSDDAFDKLKETGISDSQLYKMAGNAVTVSVVKAISERLLKYL